MSNVEQIEKHNLKFEQGLSTYKQGVNAYSDWTWEEFQDRFLLKSQNDTLKGYKVCKTLLFSLFYYTFKARPI